MLQAFTPIATMIALFVASLETDYKPDNKYNVKVFGMPQPLTPIATMIALFVASVKPLKRPRKQL